MGYTKFTIPANRRVANSMRQQIDPRAQLYWNDLEGGWQMIHNGRYRGERKPTEQIWHEYESEMEENDV